ncbi:MAG TPA: hypothetical protein VE011_03920 [Candidatus Dormibacteraeota bacterium]|nr:hypothetical protein [Candidatus Dormibacteraeota bacterium]
MAEFQWWLLLVGLVAGGGLVAVVTMDGRRREEDLADVEREAEANWIAQRVHGLDHDIDAHTVASILRIHREYLGLPPPDRIVGDGGDARVGGAGDPAELPDGDPDRGADEVGDDGSGRADQDLSPA